MIRINTQYQILTYFAGAFILFEAVLAGHFDINTLQDTLGRAIVVGLVLGFGVGIPWMYVSTKLANAQHGYMLTLGILFVLLRGRLYRAADRRLADGLFQA